MIAEERWTTFEELRYAPAGAAGSFYYLPLAPSAQLDPAGRPAVSLLAAGNSAFLQLGAQWDPPAAAIERLREHLTADSAGPVSLAPPALTMGAAALLCDDHELQAIPTSGYPPWMALFAVSLDPGARSAATAALHGETGHLLVRFDAELQGGGLRLQADVGTWFAARSGQDHTHVVATEGIAGLSRFDQPAPPGTDQGGTNAQDR